MYNQISINQIDKKYFKQKSNIPKIIKDKRFVMYGAGDMCKMALQFFKIYNIEPLKIYDQKVKFINGYKVLHPKHLIKQNPKKIDICVCLSNRDFLKIIKKFKKYDFNILHFYEFSEVFKKKFYLQNGWRLNQPLLKFGKIKKIKNFFEDEKSHLHYINFVMWHYNRSIIKEYNYNDNIYLNEITNNFFKRKNLFFLNLGSGVGNKLKIFFEKKISFKKILCLDGCKYANLILYKKFRRYKNLKILNKIISDRVKRVYFKDNLYHISKISHFGKVRKSITVDRLDISPDVIKYHLEGEEFKALKGSIKTINKFKPMLLINIYHNSDGLFRIYEFLMKFKNLYKFYLRGHSIIGTNYVLYCIPKQ